MMLNNKDKLNIILKIRDIRKNLNNLDNTSEVQEILRRALNYYENELILGIEISNNNIELLKQEGIDHEEYVSIPLDDNFLKYHEYANLTNANILSSVEYLISNINSISLSDDQIKIILNCLKEYCLYLNQIHIKKINNEKYLEELGITK